MGALDAEGKIYLSNNRIFADAFNYLLYDGKEVIRADDLQELDTTQIASPYGNSARLPVQKYRDILKLWNAMMDDNMIYVILGGEIQGSVHYGMPVKDGLYDMIGYSKQIEEARRSYNNKTLQNLENKSDNRDEADLFVENGTLKIKLTSEEFLSGFRKGDKLIPIVTAVVYLGADPWDGPLSLFDMMDVKDKNLYRFLNDYKLNLISPANMSDEDFAKFHTNLGFAMKVIKHQKDDADRIIGETDHRKIDADTAFFLNRAVNLGLEYDTTEGGVDMCLAMEKKEQRDKITAIIEYMRDEGKSDDDIIAKIIEKYKVTREYVISLLNPSPAAL